MSTLASIIDWIWAIWVLALPSASVTTSLPVRPLALSWLKISSSVPWVCFIQVGTE